MADALDVDLSFGYCFGVAPFMMLVLQQLSYVHLKCFNLDFLQ